VYAALYAISDHIGRELERDRKHEPFVVVGVFSDQVRATRRPLDDGRFLRKSRDRGRDHGAILADGCHKVIGVQLPAKAARSLPTAVLIGLLVLQPG
jgi:hypothetical protein